MPRSCYIQLSAAIDGSLSLPLSPLLDEENRGRHIRSAANSNNSWLARSHEGRLSKPLQGNLWPPQEGRKKREKERKKKKRRRRRKNRVLSPLIARSTGMPSVPPWEQEVNDPRQIAGNATPCLRFPFFFPSTDSFPRPRDTANGAWMSWMSCLAAETPDVLNATSNIDTRRSLGQDAWPLLSFPSCLLSFGHIRIRGCGGGRSRVMWLGTLGEEFSRWWSLEMWIDVM